MFLFTLVTLLVHLLKGKKGEVNPQMAVANENSI